MELLYPTSSWCFGPTLWLSLKLFLLFVIPESTSKALGVKSDNMAQLTSLIISKLKKRVKMRSFEFLMLKLDEASMVVSGSHKSC